MTFVYYLIGVSTVITLVLHHVYTDFDRFKSKYKKEKILQTKIKTCKHGLFNYMETKAKCRHIKTFTCNGTQHIVYVYPVYSHREGGGGAT
jgi:hypothetical protein